MADSGSLSFIFKVIYSCIPEEYKPGKFKTETIHPSAFMKAFFIILFFSWLSALMLPWWSLPAGAFLLGGWLVKGKLASFFIGFFAGGLGWFLQALYINISNDAILSSRIAELTGTGSAWSVLAITFLVAAVLSGFASLAGTAFIDFVSSSRKN